MNDIGSIFATGAIPIFIVVSIVWLLFNMKKQQRKLQSIEASIHDLEARFGKLQFQETKPETSSEPTDDANLAAEEEPTVAQQETKLDQSLASAGLHSKIANSNETAQQEATTRLSSPWEWILGVNWLVWIGGIALAFGGVFIVMFSIDNNMLGPWSRITIGILLGLIMLAVGEWFRRQPEYLSSSTSWQYLPLAVSGAGLMTIYGAVYSGFSFYELYPPLVAVILLALTASGGLAYSLLLGPIMGAVGLLGAYVVPLLIATTEPSTELLFLYLFAVLVGSLAILRFRSWNWLGSSNLGASVFWVCLWYIHGGHNVADALVVEIYLAGLVAVYIFVFAARNTESPNIAPVLPRLSEILDRKTPQFQIYISFIYTASAGLFIASAFDHQTLAILLLMVLSPIAVFVARRGQSYEGLPIVAHAAAFLLLLSWPGALLDNNFSQNYSPVLKDNTEILRFLVIAIVIGLFYTAFGYYRIVKGYFAATGAAHTVAGPILIFCISYWHFNGFGTAPEWAIIAVALSAIYAFAAHLVRNKLNNALDNAVLAVFAIGSTAALALAFSVALENEWLSIALALQVAATAWIYVKIPIPALRPFSAILTAIVIIQLELNGEVLRLFVSPAVAADGFLYGFAIAVAAFGIAWTWFRKVKTDYLIIMLESGMVLLWTTLIALGIRKLAGVGILPTTGGEPYFSVGMSLAEVSLQIASLLANALGLYWLNKRNRAVVRDWGWRILGMLGLIQLVFGAFGLQNPLFSTQGSVGPWYILDWLFVAYAFPAVTFVLFKAIAKTEHIRLARILTIFAGFLIFFYINTEIRHFFVGNDIRLSPMSNPEFYTYSLVWLIIASGLMFVGIWRDSQLLRQSALLLLLAAVGKVFVFDMAALDGLLRAVSFLGLGACLIGIGFLYQRYGKNENALE